MTPSLQMHLKDYHVQEGPRSSVTWGRAPLSGQGLQEDRFSSKERLFPHNPSCTEVELTGSWVHCSATRWGPLSNAPTPPEQAAVFTLWGYKWG